MTHPLALVESDEIGEDTRIWAFAHVMKDARIGRSCNIGEHCYIEQGVTLGNNVTVKNGVNVWTGVTVEDNVFLGPNCVLTNDPNPRAYIKKSVDSLVVTLIRSNATIGANGAGRSHLPALPTRLLPRRERIGAGLHAGGCQHLACRLNALLLPSDFNQAPLEVDKPCLASTKPAA